MSPEKLDAHLDAVLCPATDSDSPDADTLDDEHPLWLINEQIKGLLEGEGASEDHQDVLAFLARTGLPPGTVSRIHRAIVWGDTKLREDAVSPSGGTMNPASRPHDEAVVEMLREDLAFADEYLAVALEEADEAGGQEALRKALRHVAEAQGTSECAGLPPKSGD